MPRRATVDVRAMLAFCESQQISRAQIVRHTRLSRQYVGRLVAGDRGVRPGYEVVTSIAKLYEDVVAGRVVPIGTK
jgi:hypothetical protein